MATGKSQKQSDGSALDFEAQLWAAADKMRGHMDASGYKHVCLGLIFLKSNYTTWKLARMNLAIRGIDANLGPRNADSFRADLHPDLQADFVPVWKDLANPPFNMSDWGGENLGQDVRWKFGMPPVNNARTSKSLPQKAVNSPAVLESKLAYV
jgi:type I restriction-modification system DNA methylase subunit